MSMTINQIIKDNLDRNSKELKEIATRLKVLSILCEKENGSKSGPLEFELLQAKILIGSAIMRNNLMQTLIETIKD